MAAITILRSGKIAIFWPRFEQFRPSVTRRYCVKTAARSRMQFSPLDSKMCLVLYKPKNIPQGQPLPPEILAQSDLPTPEGCEF